MMGWASCFVEMAPFAAMVIMECLMVGLGTLSKAAMSKGMSHFVLAVYANALAFLLILPFAFFFNRAKRPPLNFSILCKFFLLSLVGSTINPNCTLAGIDYSSPTLGSAMRNLIPAFTFSLAVIFRMEKVNLRSCSSQVKIMATLLSICGALILTIYKGPPLGSSGDEILLSKMMSSSHQLPMFLSNPLLKESNWIIGGILLATASLCIAIWITAQGVIVKQYPSEINIVTFYMLFGSIQCAAVALVAEQNHPNAWRIRPDVELLTVVYSALFATLGVFFVDIWCIRKKGPLFVAMFKPLGVAIAAFMNFIFLGERLHVGTIVGSVIIIIGFYGVIWAKSKDTEDEGHVQASSSYSWSEKMPLLQSDRDVSTTIA